MINVQQSLADAYKECECFCGALNEVVVQIGNMYDSCVATPDWTLLDTIVVSLSILSMLGFFYLLSLCD